MNNTELTLDQLADVNGAFARYTLSMHQGAMNSFSRRGLDVGPVNRRGLSVGPIGRGGLNVWTNGSASSFQRFRGTYNLAALEQQP